MKKQITMTLTMLCLIVTLAVTSAKAQSHSHFMRINIPFEFIIRGETLPPGSYIVKRGSDKPETLLLSSTDGGSRVYILTKNVRARSQSQSKLVFQQYGDQYFLSQVWEAGENVGRQLFESRGERTARELLAKDTMKRQTVTLIAQR